MASKAAKVIGGLVLLGVAGAIAVGATAEDEEPPQEPVETYEAAGLSIAQDCATITVLDVDALFNAMDEYFEASGAEQWFDPTDSLHVEQILLDFLASVAPHCYPPIPDGFAWITTGLTRTWDEIVADAHEAIVMVAEGFEAEGEGVPYDIEAVAHVLATGELPYEPKIPTPDMMPPVSPEAAMAPEQVGGDVVPQNVLQVADEAHMRQAGIDLAMEAEGALSPQRAAVFLVYDPEYPQLDELVGDVYALAREEPEVLWVLASSWDTQRELGVPEKLGVFGYAYNAANNSGQWLYAEGTQANRDKAPPPEARWDQIVDHATGPHAAEPSLAMS